jgi:hypothetical protein
LKGPRDVGHDAEVPSPHVLVETAHREAAEHDETIDDVDAR